jgi:N-succinyldiaminopimelate aminotransferase
VGTLDEPLNSRLAGFGTTIFAEMSALAVATGSVNLGQGFPDSDGPDVVLETAIAAIRAGVNQYPPGIGIPELRDAVAAHQRRFYGLDYDPATEVLVTAGATEALAGALLGMLDLGDEVVLFEPIYDSYPPVIAMAGATFRPVLLQPGDDDRYHYDIEELRAAITPRTKILLLNTPHNPTGKVFTHDELSELAALAIEHDLIVVTDEVYEHLVFPGARHESIASIPGMRERTLVISSGGKTFNTTGWKIGWVCGPPPLVDAAKTAKQFLTYVNGAPFQPAIAAGLALGDDFYRELAADLTAKRDRLYAGLVAAGFHAYLPEATYFIIADIRPVDPAGDGMSFCRELPQRCGVVAIPSEVMYARRELGHHLVRFACCKSLDVIDEAVGRLATLAEKAAP